jgi:hypothetical protein
MSLERCPLQYACPDFSWKHKNDGGSEIKDEWHRTHMVCQGFLDMTCETSIQCQLKMGESMACSIDKGRK